MSIENHPVGIKLRADHGVAAGLAINSEIKSDGLVAVWSLDLASGQDSEHGPEGMGDRACLREIAVAQQNAHTVGASTVGAICNRF